MAITSTYRPFFLPLAPPLVLGIAGPSKSSISLALLILVAGLLGGFREPGVGGPLPGGLLRGCGIDVLLLIGGPEKPIAEDGGAGGMLGELIDGGVPFAERPLVDGLGVSLGGGGVADGVTAVSFAPAALLTHLLSSGSKTNWLDSPRLAFVGFFAASRLSSFFAPPNQPPNQPDLGLSPALGRAALIPSV